MFNLFRFFSIESFIGKIEVFHSSDWTQPKTWAKKVTTIHDLVPIKYPQWSIPEVIKVHKRRLKLIEQEIDQVIVVSESTKKDLMELSSIPSEKITVIYEAPSADFSEPSEQEKIQFLAKYKLPRNFVLAIGGVGDRRNLDRVREAAKDYNLVVTGIDIPWLDIEELGVLYHTAQVLLYPSFYEGFGLPILDAFVCGLPVITSNVSSMPEVGGKGAYYVDPNNVDEIRTGIERIIKDQELKQELIRLGKIRAKDFNWKKTAEQTVEVYRELTD